MMPVVLGLIIIGTVFYLYEPTFLSSRSLVSMMLFAAPVGIISLGIVIVLLLGEIDLSVGSVSGFAAAVMAVLLVDQGRSLWLAMGAAILVGAVIGAFYAALFVWVGVPSFVFSLAGLLAFEGALLWVLSDGSINVPRDSGIAEFARNKFLTDGQAYLLVAVVTLAYLGSRLWAIRQRRAAGLTPPNLLGIILKTAALGLGLAWLTYYLGIARGWGYLPVLFAALVVLMDFLLRRTRWGRHLFAIGGNEEAARRSGIRVGLVYCSAFVLCSAFAALGGVLAAAQLTSVSQASGTGDTNLTAIAAAVIGGTSLFGGRGSAYAAMLGILVLQAIESGLNLMNVDSDVRFIVTGGVLLLAVAIDSVARRARSSSGRG
ncbi:sugar ABC transporter permease [Nocardioides antri]|uniref:Xylose transport system permease protein XylH n=2 Tax=Nocardioides antri TaxID=2607659 RepID=A0A5B1M5F1_9ACTN|nr:sugar ABC transporter permease [Nocardioides antri]